MKPRMVELSEVIVDIAAGPFGSNLKVSCFVDDGFPIIDGANLRGYKVTDNITKYVTDEKARSLSRSIARRGDVVVTISGNVGQISYIPNNSRYEAYLCSQRQFRVTFDFNRVYVPYLVFYFHTYEGQHKILSFANQTGVPALSQPLKNFKKIKVFLPEIEQQRRIANIIELINDKIECNEKINKNLTDQIQTIYCNQFSPITHTPTGVLSDVCHFSTDRIPVSLLTTSTYYSTENMLPEKVGAVEATSLPSVSQTTKCHKGDVLISNIRPYFKKIVYVTEDCGCSADVLCFTPQEAKLSAFVFGTLFIDRFFDYMVVGAKGTKMPRGDKKQIMNYPIVLPSSSSLALYNNAVMPMIVQMDCNRAENKRLAILRDTLLPHLISGEIDVSDINL